jgi:CheY-like chemotaxis protein
MYDLLSVGQQRAQHLLLVDDEEGILQSLRRMLRRDGYTIHLATSGEAGLQILEREPIGVIVSDQRMPGMTGSEFLSKVKERYPDTIRIVLSGYTELNSIADAINQGAIYKFLTKPWDDELLRNHIREAFQRFDLKAENARLAAFNQAMIDAVPDALILVNIVSRTVVSANAAASRMLMTPTGDLIGKPITDIEALPVDQCYWDEIAGGGFRPISNQETEYQTADGDWIPIRKSIASTGGDGQSALILAQDIRRERATESSLERLTAEMAAIFETTSDGLLVLDENVALTRMNRRLTAQWEFPDECLGGGDAWPLLNWIAGQSSAGTETGREFRSYLESPVARADGEFQRVNGEKVRWYANPLVVSDQLVGHVFGFAVTVPVEVWAASG